MVHTVAADWQGTERCTKSDEDDDEHSIALVSGEHHERRLRHKSRAIEVLADLGRRQDVLLLHQVRQVTDKEENNSEGHIGNGCDEAAVGKVEI